MSWECPVPLRRYPHIVLGHGAGGALMRDLVAHVFAPAFGGASIEDAAALEIALTPGERLAMTTDSFVVTPRFFPGGDIGKLAVCGTVNDLAVSGADARALSAAFVIEEGVALEELARIAASMGAVCAELGVRIVCGDTKIVERGKGDGVFITTTGVGVIARSARAALSIRAARDGDVVLVSGPLGDHGIAIMSARAALSFTADVVSDCAPLIAPCSRVRAACPSLRFMRDATRGGLNAVLHELAAASDVGVVVDERALPVRPAVRAACELLGLDVVDVANEGCVVAVVSAEDADACRAALGLHAAAVARVTADHAGVVHMTSALGAERVLRLPVGESLPRIC